MLNTDLKLLAKILAIRLEHIIRELIHPDRDNTMRAVDIIHTARSSGLPVLLLSTEAEKAFEQVDWRFLAATLEQIGLGPHMRAWIGALYSSPTTSVRVNLI